MKTTGEPPPPGFQWHNIRKICIVLEWEWLETDDFWRRKTCFEEKKKSFIQVLRNNVWPFFASLFFIFYLSILYYSLIQSHLINKVPSKYVPWEQKYNCHTAQIALTQTLQSQRFKIKKKNRTFCIFFSFKKKKIPI